MLLHRLLDDGANRRPDHRALSWVDRDRSLTYAEAVEQVDAVAGALAELGVEPGDRVAIFAHNGLDYLLAMFGTWRIGAISALVNVSYADQLDYYINDSDPVVLIYTGDHHATIERHRAAMPSVQHYVNFDGPAEGSGSWPELVTAGLAAPDRAVDEHSIAHLSYTSGTSGNPKGVCLGHEPTATATRCIAERLRVSSADVSFGPTALSSSYQLVANLLPALHRHGTACVQSRWDPAAAHETLERVGATLLIANPPILADVLTALTPSVGPPASLRVAVSGGGPVPPALKRAWHDDLGVPLAESYGQSELGGFVGLGFPGPVTEEKLAACGPPLPDKDVRIVDDAGDEMPIGTIGEIVVGGGHMVSYWNRPEQSAAVLRNGWLHTGDVGFVDADDFVYMRGRLSERLTVGGNHWYPRDLEESLTDDRWVTAAALIGLDDEALGQRPLVFVTATDGFDPSAALQAAAARLGYDISMVELRLIDEMPMTPTGKISKAQLLDQV